MYKKFQPIQTALQEKKYLRNIKFLGNSLKVFKIPMYAF